MLAVHDQDMQLDGDISLIDQNPAGPGAPSQDWIALFDVVGDDVPTPKDTLPTGFLTADFVRDFVPGQTGPDRTTFATGSKDTLNITPGWQCARDNNVNDKTDVVNAYATVFRDTGEVKLYFALERFSNEGAGNVAFWFLNDETVDCLAPATGPSTTSFVGNHEDGDILVVAEFTVGGTVTSIKAFEWVGGAGGFLNPTPIADGADCRFEPTGDDICATVNLSPIPRSAAERPWLSETKQPGPTPNTVLEVSEFFEGGLSLTQFGLADRCFGRFLADTRSSPSLTATIFDYAVGSLDLCMLEVVKTGPELSKVGDDVTYTITITNTGAVTLHKQDITDDVLGNITLNGVDQAAVPPVTNINNIDCGASLAPSASCTIEVTRTVQAGDADPLMNTVTAAYDSQSNLSGDEVSASDDHSVNLFEPSVAIEKTADTSLSKEGDTVNYTLKVTNTSSSDSPNLTCDITDALLGVNKNVNLAPSAMDTTNVPFVVPGGSNDPLENTANVNCTVDGFGNPVSDMASVSVNLFQPSFTLAKQCSPDPVPVGGILSLKFTITNTSSSDSPSLERVSVTDTKLGDLSTDFPASLEPGQSVMITKQETVTSADAPAHTNEVTANYRVLAPFLNPLSQMASATCQVQAPEGCTPGFWKNHTSLWDGVGGDDLTTNIQTTDLFNATFGVTSAFSGLANNVTLFEALSVSGSNLMALNRHAAAALVNADSGIAFGFSVAQVIALYQDAVGAVPGPETIESALQKLMAANEAGCPLS